jgi:hypothetical protein
MLFACVKGEGAKCGSHPLFTLSPLETSTQDFEKKKGGAKNSAFS